jgi:malonyl-CoA/methylmalonyl-CoA synthetase
MTYGALDARSRTAASVLLGGLDDLAEARVAFLVPPGIDWVLTQWGIWRAGGIAVPLAISHPLPELAWVIEDSAASIVVGHPAEADRVEAMARARDARFLTTDRLAVAGSPAAVRAVVAREAAAERPPAQDTPSDPGDGADQDGSGRRASILYTSGTTGRPKGVVTTHANIAAAIETLVEAWGWSANDRALNVLPLHHVHGIINVLSCALWSGASCEFLPRFEARVVWDRLASGEITVFMAVPTIYHRLIAAWDEASSADRESWSRGAASLRLMVSGSAALPVPTLERWREITGHTLLERYGMTEIGMALSNPLAGERVAGTVGTPLSGVDVRLVDADGHIVPDGTSGQIEVRGPQVFLEYWRRPEETRAAFREGWFRTGDEAVIEDGHWRILGRSSIDILKSAGYKVSALEIEEVLRGHPAIVDCAVVGLPDDDLGERIVVAIVAASRSELTASALMDWARLRLAPYKLPHDVRLVSELPRNTMGKVMKPAIRTMFAPDPAGPTEREQP